MRRVLEACFAMSLVRGALTPSLRAARDEVVNVTVSWCERYRRQHSFSSSFDQLGLLLYLEGLYLAVLAL